MDLIVSPTTYVVFDLDDTLYAEREFVWSGFCYVADLVEPFTGRAVATELLRKFDLKQDALGWLLEEFDLGPTLTKDFLLQQYRTHVPRICLYDGASDLLERFASYGVKLGLLTDGRSISQRNKLKALGLSDRFDDVIISEEFGSEKPNPNNYRYFVDRYPEHSFVVIADNTGKDFLVPRELGWTTVCLKAAPWNIHSQNLDHEGLDYVIGSLRDLRPVNSA